MKKVFINSYEPLISNKYGRFASKEYDIPPFVDRSCRREPDFESRYASITSVCRKSKFVPRLSKGDTVIYITKKGKYLSKGPHWRMVAILEVINIFPSHRLAAIWYEERGLSLPSNCIVKGNKALAAKYTNKESCDETNESDREYRHRVKECGIFVVCNKRWLELHDPPVITREDFESIFGGVPPTRNPTNHPAGHIKKLLEKVGIKLSGQL